MKYSHYLLKKMVPEWAQAYIDYEYLKTLLKPFSWYRRKLIKNNSIPSKACTQCDEDKESNKISVNEPDEEIAIARLLVFSEKFENLIHEEKKKSDSFFFSKIEEILQQFQDLKRNADIFKDSADSKDEKVKQQLKNCFLSYFREMLFLVEFHQLNYEGFRKILKKYAKLTKSLPITFALKTNMNSLYSSTNVQEGFVILSKLKQDFETFYLETFYCQSHRKEGRQELLKITQNRLISKWEGYFFGLFSGCSLVLFLIILLMAYEGDLDPDKEDAYFKEIFSMYRGIGLFIGYIWLLAWNVYIYTVYHINYKRIFKFNQHYSQVHEIMKRAAFFTSVFFLTFMWYIINCEKTERVAMYFEWFPKEYCPLICWVCFLFYMCFPFRCWFNGEGRLYFYRLLRDIMCFSCVKKVTFAINWATDQLVSFVIPICDMEYTFCYYTSKALGKNELECEEADILLIPFVAAIVPLLFRMVQCLNANKTNSGRIFSCKPDFFNFLKYLSSFVTVCFSLGYNIQPSNSLFLILWVVMAFWSSMYSFCWDVKMDWGFVEPGSKKRFLRNQLAYPKARYYYAAIAINLVLRFAWITSLSYGLIQSTLNVRKELIIFCLGLAEMIRRAIWNFIRYLIIYF